MTRFAILLAGFLLLVRDLAAAGLPTADPAAAGMDAAHLKRIDDIVAQALAEKRMPGCVVCTGWLRKASRKWMPR